MACTACDFTREHVKTMTDQHMRAAMFSTEFKVCRLKWMQTFAKSPGHLEKVLIVFFGGLAQGIWRALV